jgi:hypothetical protein
LEEEKMKTKFFGMLVCLLLMTTVISIGKPVEKETIHPELNDPSPMTIDGVDVPIWNIGDSWSYKVKGLDLDIEQTNQSYHIILNTENLTFKVIDTTSSYYTIAFSQSKINGNAFISYKIEDGFINITASLNDTQFNGKLVYNKSDLGMKQIRINLSGQLQAKITEIPSITLQRPIPIRGESNISLMAEYDIPYPLITFPLDVPTIWGRPTVNISLDGTIQSLWLKRMNTINNIARKHWRFVEFLTKILGIDSVSLKNMSDICADVLPIIKIGYVLNNYSSGNIFKIAEIPPILFCNNTEDVTVTAGTFNAYNISIGIGLGNIYYAPSVGNIIKISGNLTAAMPYVKSFDIQLIYTNFPQ